MARDEPGIVLDIVDERWSQPPDGHDDHPHQLGD
jgi:hypothetical protein